MNHTISKTRATWDMLENGDCEGCDEKPTIFLTQIVNGELRQVNLCTDCPHRDEVADPAGLALAEMLIKLAAKHATTGESSEEEEECADMRVDGQVCCCGMTLAELQSAHRLGCPTCYETFREHLMESVTCTQKRGCTHHGKVPGRYADARAVELNRAALEAELDDAIAAEDFERAARTRDLLRQLGR